MRSFQPGLTVSWVIGAYNNDETFAADHCHISDSCSSFQSSICPLVSIQDISPILKMPLPPGAAPATAIVRDFVRCLNQALGSNDTEDIVTQIVVRQLLSQTLLCNMVSLNLPLILLF